MSIEVQSIGSMRVIVESTFAADATSSPGLGSFTYVPFNEGTAEATLVTDELDPNFVVQRRVQGRERVLGKRSAKLKFQINLAPTGTAAGSAVAAIGTSALGILLKAVMGGQHLGTGTTFVSGWTGITGDVTSAAGLTPGGWIGWANSAGTVEWRQIKSITSNTLVMTHGFSASPANTNVLYASATHYFTEDPSQSLQFLVSGAESDDRWLLLGGQAVEGINITLDPTGAAIPTVEFNLTFATYLESDETAGSVTGTLSDATYSNYSPIVGFAGDVRLDTVGAPTFTTSARVHVSALSFSPKIVFTPVTSPSGTMTIYRWRGGRANPPVEGDFTTFFEGLTYFQMRDSRADKALAYTLGTAAGSALVLAAPTLQILNPQRATSNEEIAGQTIHFAGRCNTDTALSTEIATSPVCIVLG
jgi:hypothetical protein